MRSLFFFLFVCTVLSAKAQEDALYPELLEMKGKVKEARIYNPNNADRFVTINYDHAREERVIRIYYTSQKNGEKMLQKEVVQSFEEMKKDIRLEFISYLFRLEQTDYRCNVIKALPQYARGIDDISKKIVYKNADDIITEVLWLDANEKMVRKKTYQYPDANKQKYFSKMTDTNGAVLLEATIVKNKNDHIVKQILQSNVENYETGALDFEYTYDSHGNFTKFTSLYSDGVKGIGFVRDIIYEE